MRRFRLQSLPRRSSRFAQPERPPGQTPHPALAGDSSEVTCPRCSERVAIAGGVCPSCGFPFICDIAEYDTPARRLKSNVWRLLLGVAALMFLLTSGIFLNTGYDEYNGLTTGVVANLKPALDSGIELIGPASFIARTELTLGLLKLRAPDFYWRVCDSVTSIEYLAPSYLETDKGRKISLEGIGALAEPATGRVAVLYTTAFPGGPAELVDRDVFVYAGVLVHELRHIELHAMGINPGGWQEEVLCERAGYAALKMVQAPPGVLLRYEIYLENPQAKQYQGWYDWYKQWE